MEEGSLMSPKKESKKMNKNMKIKASKKKRKNRSVQTMWFWITDFCNFVILSTQHSQQQTLTLKIAPETE